MSTGLTLQYCILIIAVIAIIYCYYIALIDEDEELKRELNERNSFCPLKVKISELNIDDADKAKLAEILDLSISKERKMSSHTGEKLSKKIIGGAKGGALKGILIGFIMGGGPAAAIRGAALYPVIGSFMVAASHYI